MYINKYASIYISSYVSFLGILSASSFPKSLERIDISGNKFHDISELMVCTNLQSVNASNNRLKVVTAFPSKLHSLDISKNLLTHVTALRCLSLSPSITLLRIAGNPVLNTASPSLCR
jgi:Leucine-rich repeat (LRR) protein